MEVQFQNFITEYITAMNIYKFTTNILQFTTKNTHFDTN